MPEKTLYTATVTARGGREGNICSDDRVLVAALAVPRGMGGPGGARTNPEQLFAAGYAACFEGAIRLAAKEVGIEVGPDTSVTAHVGIGPRGCGGFELVVDLDIHVDGLAADRAESLVKRAHEDICPYSHATRGNVDVRIHLV